MHIRVTYTAKVGKDRKTLESYTRIGEDGTFLLFFHKDIDWTEPVFMILDGTKAAQRKASTQDIREDLQGVSSRDDTSEDVDVIPKWYIEKAVGLEAKRPVHNIEWSTMPKGNKDGDEEEN